jgi:aminopeptidase N
MLVKRFIHCTGFGIAGLLLVILLFQSAYAAREERLIDGWQPTHFNIELEFNDSLSELTAVTTDVRVTARRRDLTMIDFDFGTMPVSAVTVEGENARFAQHDGKLDVYLPKPSFYPGQQYKIIILYSGKPQDGLILVNDKDGKPSAIGDNWPDRVHHWIPCLDHPSAKASVKFTVTAASRNSVVANGVLVSKKVNPDATTTWTWNEPHLISPYNMVVAAGQFATAELKAKAPVPISYYVTQSDRKYAEQGFSPAAPAVNLFSQIIEPYPYGKLALIVGATRFGGMENANTIVFSPGLFKDFETTRPRSRRYNVPEGVENVVAHEIAHQWFGDSVTEATWADLWLSEGFATYFAGLFLEKNEGPAAFRAYMRDSAKSYLEYEKKRRSPIHDTETEKLFDLLNPNNYEKGAWVLHELRGMLGDKAFFEGLRLYYDSKRSGTATTGDLRAALEKTSGMDLEDFFVRWVYEAGHPVYKVYWTEPRPGAIEIKLTQTQADEAFLMPVTLEIVTAKGVKRVKITPTGKEATLKVASAKPTKITVDPDEYILKEVVTQ